MSSRCCRRLLSDTGQWQASGTARAKAALKTPQSKRWRAVRKPWNLAKRLECARLTAAVGHYLHSEPVLDGVRRCHNRSLRQRRMPAMKLRCVLVRLRHRKQLRFAE